MTTRPALLAALAGALLLAGCGGRPERPDVPGHRPPPIPQPQKPRPVADLPVKIGNPYQVGGVWYVPRDEPSYDEVGLASWYGPSFHAAATANGERYDMDGVSAAHKTLPLPCYVEVTALATGRTIVLRVNDRGPFVADRIIDLSRGAARLLGVENAGVARVRVRRVLPPDADRIALRAGGPASARPTAGAIELARLNARFAAKPVVLAAAAPRPPIAAPGPPPSATPVRPQLNSVEAAIAEALAAPTAPRIDGYFVQVAALGERARADALAQALPSAGTVRVEGATGTWRVRLGPYGDEASARATLAQLKARGYGEAQLVRETAQP